jgi:HEAT repeats
MKKWKLFCGGLAALAGLTPRTWAQDISGMSPVPTIPSPAAAAAGLPSATAVAAPPPTVTLWSFLGISKPQIDVCRLKVCNSPLGQLMNNTTKPLNALGGGMLGSCCPAINPADLLKPPDSAEGLAARIKAEEADAKARRAAVRYLGTVDCRWFPEAEEVLISSLRKDRNECVRWEAALVLNRGCCCTKKVVAALTESVNGGKKIGPVPECSDRVKAAAAIALEHCLACMEGTPVEEIPLKGRDVPPRSKDLPPPPDRLPNGVTDQGAKSDVQVAAYKQIEATPMSQLKDQARRALVERQLAREPVVISSAMVKADHSLYSVLVNARKGGTHAEAAHQNEIVTVTPVPAAADSHVVVPVSATAPEKRQAAGPGKAQAATPEKSQATLAPPLAPTQQETPASVPPAPNAKLMPPVAAAQAPKPNVNESEIQASIYHPTRSPYASASPRDEGREARGDSPHPSPLIPGPSPVPAAPAKQRVRILPPTVYAMSDAPKAPAPARPVEGMLYMSMNDAAPVMRAPVTAIPPRPVGQDDVAILQFWLPTLARWDHPELRENAAVRLAVVDWRRYPEVVDGLVKAAVKDTTGSVRIASIQSLAKMGAGSPEVVEAMEKLRTDHDGRVREAAGAALAKLRVQ